MKKFILLAFAFVFFGVAQALTDNPSENFNIEQCQDVDIGLNTDIVILNSETGANTTFNPINVESEVCLTHDNKISDYLYTDKQNSIKTTVNDAEKYKERQLLSGTKYLINYKFGTTAEKFDYSKNKLLMCILPKNDYNFKLFPKHLKTNNSKNTWTNIS